MSDIVKEMKELASVSYKYPERAIQLGGEARGGAYLIERIEVDNGRLLYYLGMEYPEKGLSFVNDMWAFNIVKRLLMEVMRNWIYFVPVLFSVKRINKLIFSFNDIAFKVMSDVILKDEYMTPVGLEIKRFVNIFLISFGIVEKNSERFAEIFSNLINGDNSYRYRIQDLFNESSKDKLISNPRKEIKRLLLINRERETTHHVNVSNKFKAFASVLSLMLLVPKVKRAFIESIGRLDYDKCLPDKADRFWMCVRNDYKYLGKSHEERKMMINHLKVCKPTKAPK